MRWPWRSRRAAPTGASPSRAWRGSTIWASFRCRTSTTILRCRGRGWIVRRCRASAPCSGTPSSGRRWPASGSPFEAGFRGTLGQNAAVSSPSPRQRDGGPSRASETIARAIPCSVTRRHGAAHQGGTAFRVDAHFPGVAGCWRRRSAPGRQDGICELWMTEPRRAGGWGHAELSLVRARRRTALRRRPADQHRRRTAMSRPLLELQGIAKRFPGVVANNDVTLSVGHREIHALLGENGAGKSTLVKIVYGILRPDAGVMRLGGEVYAPARPS